MKFEPKEYELLRQHQSQLISLRNDLKYQSGGESPAGRRIRSQAKCERITQGPDWSKFKPK